MNVEGVALGLVVSALACGFEPNSSSDAAGTDSASSSSGPTTDIAADPDCWDVLEDVVSCECAMEPNCSVHRPSDADCQWQCVLPQPCAPVTCSYDGSVSDFRECETELTEESLSCVVEALASGAPMRWTMETNDSYIFVASTYTIEFQRLDATTYVTHIRSTYHNDVGEHSESERFGGYVVAEPLLMQCLSLPSKRDQFECLIHLSDATDTCPNTQEFTCPQ
jgi:hypothetical protein